MAKTMTTAARLTPSTSRTLCPVTPCRACRAVMIGPVPDFPKNSLPSPRLGANCPFSSDAGSAALLESTLQLLAAPIGLGEIIIGQLTPLLLDLAFGCLPVSFDAVPIHFVCDLPKLNGQ